LEKAQDTILICPPVVSQRAALGALQAGASYCLQFTADLAIVRQLCLDRLSVLGDRCKVPDTRGAFYLLARLRTTSPALNIVKRLVRDYRVAVIPGEAFGLVDACYVRIAFGALRQDTVAEGMDRLVDGLEKILQP